MANVYAGGPTSGGHYNPAVTVAVYLRTVVFAKQEGSLIKSAGYICTQFIAALLAGSAAAFAPAQNGRIATDLAISELELGVTEPLGVYDPLGWLDTEPEAFERRRAVERKHGRVCMAAFLGTIIHHNDIEFDGYLSPSAGLKFSDVPNGVGGFFSIPAAGIAQILAFFALVELAWMPASKYDGDYGVGYFGTDIKDPEEKARKLNVELNNGRAAMFGILGTMMHDCIDGNPFIFIDQSS